MSKTSVKSLSFEDFKQEVIRDYKICYTSRLISQLAHKETLNGRAKFAICGNGEELAQVALAKFFQKGDFRSGYYRDQTLMLALGLTDIGGIFAQLYGDTNNDTFSGGRQMNNHFASAFLDADGHLRSLAELKNSSADTSPTASQTPRALGLALASKLFRKNKQLHHLTQYSRNGNEVSVCTIGDAATSEGHFWESVNAAGVLQIPIVFVVWDNGFGISVQKELQTTKASVSEALSGFQKTEKSNGLDIRGVKGWDYAEMCVVFEEVFTQARTQHIPAVVHVQELTQPIGHSTSGSHKRYKSKERLKWEEKWDCIPKMRDWILSNEFVSKKELDDLEQQIIQEVQQEQEQAWKKYYAPIETMGHRVVLLCDNLKAELAEKYHTIEKITEAFKATRIFQYRFILRFIRRLLTFGFPETPALSALKKIKTQIQTLLHQAYNTHLFPETGKSGANAITAVAPIYSTQEVNGYEVLNHYFKYLFQKNPLLVALGEDVGQIGDVNQGMAGLQETFGKERVMDTGLRELSIIGKGIGLALRGLRPIVEIQYLDYLMFGLQPLSDDVATTHYRSNGTQSCPLIVRTRGHRLVGMFHSGSPMQMIIGSLRGMFVCVPRNMTQAIGMYNAILQTNTPALVIECLNGYRDKEYLVQNTNTFTVALGIPEILTEGGDITIVSYGATLKLVLEAAAFVQTHHQTNCEVIDVQTLLPFDTSGVIAQSLKKTNRILFADEDVPGGATAYMLQQVLEEQKGYRYLDTPPHTLSARAHRSAYGNDGDYASKPNTEDIIEKILDIISE